MTTLFCFVAVDIAVPLLVIATGVAVSEIVFATGDLLAPKRRVA